MRGWAYIACATACWVVVLVGVAHAEDEQPSPADGAAQAVLAKAKAILAEALDEAAAGRLGEAVALAEAALELQERELGPEHGAVAIPLHVLGELWMQRDDLARARRYFERALAIRERTLASTHADIRKSLKSLADVCQRQRDFTGAIAHLERLLPLMEMAESEEVAQTKVKLGSLLNDCGRSREARKILREAVDLLEAAAGEEHPATAEALNQLGGAELDLGNPEEARRCYTRALKVCEEHWGPDHPAVARAVNSLAMLHHVYGDPAAARAYYERAVRILEKDTTKYGALLGSLLSNLGSLLREEEDYEEARKVLERSLVLTEQARGPLHYRLGAPLDHLATLERDVGHYEASEALFRRALAIEEGELGKDHVSLAGTHHNLATLLELMGRDAEARACYEEAVRLYEKEPGRRDPDVAQVYLHLASLLTSLGSPEEARVLVQRSLEVLVESFGGEDPLVAEANLQLADSHLEQGHPEKALPFAKRALWIWTRGEGGPYPERAGAMYTLGHIANELGDEEEARALFEQALAIRKATYGPRSDAAAACLVALVAIEREALTADHILQRAEEAVAIFSESLGEDHASVATALLRVAALRVARSEFEEALAALRRATDVAVGSVRRTLTGLEGGQRLGLAPQLRDPLNAWLLLEPLGMGPDYRQVLRIKGLVSRADAAERRLARAPAAEWEAEADAARVATRRFASVMGKRPPSFREAELLAWQRACARAAAERERAVLRLAMASEGWRAGLSRLELGPDQVRSALSQGELLVDVLRTRDVYRAWIVPEKGEIRHVILGPAEEIDAAAAVWKHAMASPETPMAQVAEAHSRLQALVLGPLGLADGAPDGVRGVVLCPDAALATLPLGALFDDDTFPVRTVAMAQDLVPWANGTPFGRHALLVGDVDYARAEAGEAEMASAARAPALASSHRAARDGVFGSLPHSGEEIAALGGRLGKGSVTLEGTTATEARVHEAAPGKGVLHFATHGFVDPPDVEIARSETSRVWMGAAAERHFAAGQDPRLLAGLVLAGANARDGGHGDDGILTALEVSYLHLDAAELVVLSACDAAGGTPALGEGVIGLVQAFQMAGARQVLGSLWRADDAATRALMETFYEHWRPREGEGVPAAEALMRAQAHVREQERWSHPYYWAGWVLWGVALDAE